jgi:hypothetical protein
MPHNWSESNALCDFILAKELYIFIENTALLYKQYVLLLHFWHRWAVKKILEWW